MSTHIYPHTHSHTYTNTYTHVHTHTYTLTHVHTHIHTHMHTQTHRENRDRDREETEDGVSRREKLFMIIPEGMRVTTTDFYRLDHGTHPFPSSHPASQLPDWTL